MNAIQIAIALHYINETTDYNNGDFSDLLVANTIKTFKEQGMLQEQSAKTTLVATQGMKVYVDALEKIPLPQHIWAFSG